MSFQRVAEWCARNQGQNALSTTQVPRISRTEEPQRLPRGVAPDLDVHAGYTRRIPWKDFPVQRHALIRAVIAVAIASTGFVAPAFAASTTISIRPSTTQVLPAKHFTIFGTITPKVVDVTVTRQVFRQGAWRSTGTTASNRKGDYKMEVTAPAWPERLQLRVIATVHGKSLASPTIFVDTVEKITPKPTVSPSKSAKPVVVATPTPTPKPTPTPTPTATWEAAPSATPTPTPSEAIGAGGTPAVIPTAAPSDTSTVVETPTALNPALNIVSIGPGKRILGMDISRYQHPITNTYPNGAPINFNAMYKQGVRFLMIKASDGHDNGHLAAGPFFADDRAKAQAAGIYTGFYHYAYFPVSTVKADIIADAQAQADKAIARLASVGGYTAMDLPYALDVEEWCFTTNDNGSCISRVTKASATLWVKTWLDRVASKTGRKPFLYSYAAFLETYLARDTALRGYPLWIAHSGLKPADTTQYPGMKTDGTCYIHAWTLTNCQPQWSVWQYGTVNGTKYGFASGSVDVNVFNGSVLDLLALTQGVWQPAPADFAPFNETTTTTLSGLQFGLTTQPLTTLVDVRRITGGMVLSGTVAFKLLADANGIAPTAAQLAAISSTVTRIASGTWTLRVTGLPAGAWQAQVTFKDASGVHAASSVPLVFALVDPNPPPPSSETTTAVDTSTASAAPSAVPSPTPAATPSPTA